MGLVGEYRQMGKAGDGLQTQISLFAQLLLLFLKLQLRPAGVGADSRFLNPDLLRIGHNDIEGRVTNDRNILGAVRGESELDGGCERLVNPGWQDFIER